MSERANPTLIGAFVVGAVGLAVSAILVFGSGALFHEKHPFVLYFEGDVNGLSVGSPVKFQGVPVGSVKSIRLLITPEGATTIIPVTIQLDQSVIERKSGQRVSFEAGPFERAIENGLRARIETESLVTGQRYVALAILPDTPAKLLGLDPDMDEIPTLPATLEELRRVIDRFKDVDIQGLSKDLVETSSALRALLTSPETQAIPTAVVKTLASIDDLVKALKVQLDPLASRVADTSKSVEKIASGIDVALTDLRPTMAALRETAQRTQAVEEELAKTLATARGIMNPEAPLVVQLQATLQEFGATARSLRAVAELVERDPGALLRGKELPSRP